MGTVSSFFYGYSAQQIAEWCGTSLKTAQLYKAGRRKPSRQALRLFSLFRDGRVLSGVWRDCCVRGDRLVDPEDQSVTLGQLRAYWIVMQLAAEYARLLGPDQQERYYDALQLAIPNQRGASAAVPRRSARQAPLHRVTLSTHPTRPTNRPLLYRSLNEKRATDGPPQKIQDVSRRPRRLTLVKGGRAPRA